MQRMSDMLTRWLDGANRSSEEQQQEQVAGQLPQQAQAQASTAPQDAGTETNQSEAAETAETAEKEASKEVECESEKCEDSEISKEGVLSPEIALACSEIKVPSHVDKDDIQSHVVSHIAQDDEQNSHKSSSGDTGLLSGGEHGERMENVESQSMQDSCEIAGWSEENVTSMPENSPREISSEPCDVNVEPESTPLLITEDVQTEGKCN